MRKHAMDAGAVPATIPITARLPATLVTKLDALAKATERNRTYWVQEAVEEVIERELRQVREIEEAIADDDSHHDEGMTGDQLAGWMIEHGLTTREALDQAAARQRQGP